MLMTLSRKPQTLSGSDERKECLDFKMLTRCSSATELFDYPTILCSSTFSEEDTQSNDAFTAAMSSLHYQQQNQPLMERSTPTKSTNGRPDRAETTATVKNYKRDDNNICRHETYIFDRNDISIEEEETVSGCCTDSDLHSFGNVFKFLQFHEM